MTVCGLVRLDGAPVRRSILTGDACLVVGGPAPARGVHIDGPFGVMTATAFSGDPTPPIAVDAEKPVVVLDGCLGFSRWSNGSPAQLRGAGMPAVVGHPRHGPGLGRIRCLGPDERLVVCLPTAPAGYLAMPAGAPYPSGCGAPADAW
ncbi:hypothetical protein FDG2_0967 [Candidatus Protofrankia californiensis]|uniref:Uncharacterized protein n=1 Tax=Candidatus Protofrankia californiensis TaxID=1839754 RepID=A0A1C3NUP0_9ACTN|nr:hypothetical protein FDG2_0967 [Candidatus Protofrankia californiensis]